MFCIESKIVNVDEEKIIMLYQSQVYSEFENFSSTFTVMMRKIRYIGEISLKIFKWFHNLHAFTSAVH